MVSGIHGKFGEPPDTMMNLRRWCSCNGSMVRGGETGFYLASPLTALFSSTAASSSASTVSSAKVPVLTFRGSTADFQGALAGGAPTLVQFYTEWCAPCRRVEEPFRTLAETHSAVRFVKVNVESSLEVSALHDIRSIPTFVAFKQGRLVGRLEGANTEDLAKMVADLEDERPLPADHADPLD